MPRGANGWRKSRLKDELGVTDDQIKIAIESGVLKKQSGGWYKDDDVQVFITWIESEKEGQVSQSGMFDGDTLSLIEEQTLTPKLVKNAKAMQGVVKVASDLANANAKSLQTHIKAARLVDMADASAFVEYSFEVIVSYLKKMPQESTDRITTKTGWKRSKVEEVLRDISNDAIELCRKEFEDIPRRLDEHRREQEVKIEKRASSASKAG